MKVDLNSIQNIKNFVEICSKYPFEIVAKRNRYIVDAKSLMGILSLDLSQPVQIEVILKNDSEQEEKLMKLTEELKQFSKGV